MTSAKPNILASYFDCVVMLTWSDWKTEPRSNRYHYATRFSRHLPVLFVQPDLDDERTEFEGTDVEGVEVLHVYSVYGNKQSKLLNRAILEKGYIRPLLWIYNPHFSDFIAQRFSPLSIFHATENFYLLDISRTNVLYKQLDKTLQQTDLLVAVSEEVLNSYVKEGGYMGKTILLPNGCDYGFWAPTLEEIEETILHSSGKRIALYQGGLNWRLDWSIIEYVGKSLPDWEVWLCGALDPASKEDLTKISSKNIKHLGYLDSERVREISHAATVGIIPFRQIDIMRVSLPLKAYEYVACGLPVVSIPIKALESHGELFEIVKTPEEFVEAIKRVAPSRYDRNAIQKRMSVAQKQDYDLRFDELTQRIDSILRNRDNTSTSLNILVLYDAHSIHVGTIREHLQSFSAFSKSNVFYAFATHNMACANDLSAFDVIVIHYCVRLAYDWHLSPSFAEALRDYGGYKILFIQDEYDTTETARQWIASLGIHVIFTCVPDEYVELVYPSSRFPYLERIQTLTGYVPTGAEKHNSKPLTERKNIIGYRGRPLPFYYGDLAREKIIIAEKMKQFCMQWGIPSDIEYTHEKRIYGNKWYEFLEDCRATLGTESGSNVFDEYGHIKEDVELALEKDPSLTYEEIHARYIGAEEGRIKMNQISPRIFEAVAFRTALILFEGTYSGVVHPHVHYIPLKKDFSNVDEVFQKLNDVKYLEGLTERAYTDIIGSGKYSYEQFICEFDNFLMKRIVKRANQEVIIGAIGVYDPAKQESAPLEYKSKAETVMLSPISKQLLLPDRVITKPGFVDQSPVEIKITLNLLARAVISRFKKVLTRIRSLTTLPSYLIYIMTVVLKRILSPSAYNRIKNLYNRLRSQKYNLE